MKLFYQQHSTRHLKHCNFMPMYNYQANSYFVSRQAQHITISFHCINHTRHHTSYVLKRVNQSIIEAYKHTNNSAINLAQAKELSLKPGTLAWARSQTVHNTNSHSS